MEELRHRTVTDCNASSGMCKAGFAGDDAPRAVFRKSRNTCPQAKPVSIKLTAQQRPSSADHAIMGML